MITIIAHDETGATLVKTFPDASAANRWASEHERYWTRLEWKGAN